MKKIVEMNKCPNCGAKLESTDRPNILRCASCDSEFTTEDVAEERTEEVSEDPVAKKAHTGEGFTKTEWFEYRIDYKSLAKGSEGKEMLSTFVYCINELGTSEAIIKYIRRELGNITGVCHEGHRADKMDAFIHRAIKGALEADDQALFYANSGIFSAGKKGFLVTDNKVIFSGRKPHILKYADLHTIAFDVDPDFAYIRLNGESATTIGVIEGGSCKPHGALVALICAFAFEENPHRERIIISKYEGFDEDENEEEEDEE
ncbi:MAG: hypothetical protein J5518_05915 [Lachnospiraceae bacterium]|nr:hypothetical protein [Lachnospiraceae bacterium]